MSQRRRPMNMKPMSVSRDKAEQEMSQSVRKAVSPEESAPKQKHVRVAAVFTWDWQTSTPFWNALKLHMSMSDEVQVFKALITVHKVMRDGHPSMLQETMRELPFFDALARSMQYASQSGYGRLIQAYIQFLKAKLEFHSLHPGFTADFDYEEYRALKKVDDPNEGYLTITELSTLQDKVDDLQKTVFANLRASANNECRISALVPLVEESYGIYKFITAMLNAMHSHVEAHDALGPLRDRYKEQYRVLQKFYNECSNLRYLTSLITIPRLPDLPPDFTDVNGPKCSEPPSPRERTPPPEDLWNSVSAITPENWAITTGSASSSTEHQQMMIQQQMVLQNNAHQELMALRQQNAQAQQLLSGYEGRLRQLEDLVRQKDHAIMEYESRLMTQANYDSGRELRDREKDELIRALQEQVAQWKTKYENIAKMYAQLRKEHMELLQRFKDIQKLANSAKELSSEKDKLAAQLKERNTEMSELRRTIAEVNSSLASAKEISQREVTQLKSELTTAQRRFDELLHTVGNETESLSKQFASEKHEMSVRLGNLQTELDRQRQLARTSEMDMAELKADLDAKTEEIAVLQAGMDQSLLALQQVQEKNSGTEADLLARLDGLTLDHRTQMDSIMDSVLEDGKLKIGDGIFELESSVNPGNASATPELVLSLLEKLGGTSSDFAAAFSRRIIQQTNNSGTLDADAIRLANNLAQALVTLMNNAKGVATKTGNDSTLNEFTNVLKSTASNGQSFFNELQSSRLSQLELTERPKKVHQLHSEFQSTLPAMVKLTEALVVSSSNNTQDDLDDLVDNELRNAAKAIEEAALHFQRLLETERDPSLMHLDLPVHQSILSSSKAITDAIARLIICATHSQQEIVANGKGTGTKSAFYKKNNRWMEGLISAAKAVATATKFLVECADGVVHGTHSMEQLVVAAQEVSAATAQLVAASRVKAARGSKTQDKLEQAAKAVTQATRLLVQAAENVREHQAAAKGDVIDYAKLTPHEFKKREMEQQVQILTLEKRLIDERKKLSEMRRAAYHREADYAA